MPGRETAEIYFVAGMMIVILIVSTVAVYLFVRTYRREMRDRDQEKAQKTADAAAQTDQTNIDVAP